MLILCLSYAPEFVPGGRMTGIYPLGRPERGTLWTKRQGQMRRWGVIKTGEQKKAA
jgi:hypothetical protein